MAEQGRKEENPKAAFWIFLNTEVIVERKVYAGQFCPLQVRGHITLVNMNHTQWFEYV
jgi:hypothetical protein